MVVGMQNKIQTYLTFILSLICVAFTAFNIITGYDILQKLQGCRVQCTTANLHTLVVLHDFNIIVGVRAGVRDENESHAGPQFSSGKSFNEQHLLNVYIVLKCQKKLNF